MCYIVLGCYRIWGASLSSGVGVSFHHQRRKVFHEDGKRFSLTVQKEKKQVGSLDGIRGYPDFPEKNNKATLWTEPLPIPISLQLKAKLSPCGGKSFFM